MDSFGLHESWLLGFPVIRTILVLIFFTSIFESIENDQTISYAHFPYGKVQEWKNAKDNIKVRRTFLTSQL